MASEPIYARRKKVTASYLLASQYGNDQSTETCYSLDSLPTNVIKPLYELKKDGTVIGESQLVQVVYGKSCHCLLTKAGKMTAVSSSV
jgi:hypothetical protein